MPQIQTVNTLDEQKEFCVFLVLTCLCHLCFSDCMWTGGLCVELKPSFWLFRRDSVSSSPSTSLNLLTIKNLRYVWTHWKPETELITCYNVGFCKINWSCLYWVFFASSSSIPPTLLQLIIGGLGKIDLADWKTNTRLKHCTSESNVVRWFWQAVEAFSEERRGRLLQFVTGSTRVPLQGFKALQGGSCTGSETTYTHQLQCVLITFIIPLILRLNIQVFPRN